MSIRSRAKGAQGERELAEVFRTMGYTARRTQQYCGSNGDSDITVDELPGLLIECKRVERLNIDEAMSKAKQDAAAQEKTPMVCHRKNGGDWMLTVPLAQLHTFVERVQRGMAQRVAGSQG
jgi:Holliday junction resolvase